MSLTNALRIEYFVSIPERLYARKTLEFRIEIRHKKALRQKLQYLSSSEIDALPEPDRSILQRIRDCYHSIRKTQDFFEVYTLNASEWRTLLPLMCQTGHCYRSIKFMPAEPLRWAGDPPWPVLLELLPVEEGLRVHCTCRHALGSIEGTQVSAANVGGLIVHEQTAGLLEEQFDIDALNLYFAQDETIIPTIEIKPFLDRLFSQKKIPQLNLEPLGFTRHENEIPQPLLRLLSPAVGDGRPKPPYRGQLRLRYGECSVAFDDERKLLADLDRKKIYQRNRTLEKEYENKFFEVGFTEFEFPNYQGVDDPLPELLPSKLEKAVGKLFAAGWEITYDDAPFDAISAAEFKRLDCDEGFVLLGTICFGRNTLPVEKVLQTVAKGLVFVELEKGGLGWIEPEWSKRLKFLNRLGTFDNGRLTFGKSQISMITAALERLPECQADESFDQWKRELAAHRGIRPCHPSNSFNGSLRDYQELGLGWLLFLRQYGWNGCLADDMGLGKTVQVLALLELHRLEKSKNQPRKGNDWPSIVVAPLSLVFNWHEEANRFAPELKVLEHLGQERRPPGKHFQEYDLIVTTYGMLRNDLELLQQIPFDYLILDEAQQIKNAQTVSARAAMSLQARHRLALTGTPVENKISDLWSIFEFLNPGMLGRSNLFDKMLDNSLELGEEALALIRQALQPFILRRTKQSVASELPDKIEQTIRLDMSPLQLELYEKVRQEGYHSLKRQIETEGMDKTRFSIFTLLLRLRQIACHPGLVDKSLANEACPKFDFIFEQLEQVLQGNHKSLVFSQFTTMLVYLKRELDARGIKYLYLDGKSKHRQKLVEQFQSDPESRLFLISLKAGGTGLNLTAAEYVYLLDPWWNPAVEAQAIDRAHRIGQTQQVFAYRLIARNTVEERIRILQQHKKQLADALISENATMLKNLTVDDLELLLGQTHG